MKLFSPRELVASVGAVWRRGTPSIGHTVTVGPLTLDPCRREVRVNGQVVPLRLREYELLAYLCSHVDPSLAISYARVWILPACG